MAMIARMDATTQVIVRRMVDVTGMGCRVCAWTASWVQTAASVRKAGLGLSARHHAQRVGTATTTESACRMANACVMRQALGNLVTIAARDGTARLVRSSVIGDQRAPGMGNVWRMEAAYASPVSWAISATSVRQACLGSIATSNAMSRTRARVQAAVEPTDSASATASPASPVSVVFRVASSALRGDTASNAMWSAIRRLPALLTGGAARTAHANAMLGSLGKIALGVTQIYSGRAAQSIVRHCRGAEDGGLVTMRAIAFAKTA